ncbi:hypothetical protein XI25_04675 [Paenibacillus sp. DMB20]|nr:hypothetical protein XI25_04675 [Paenibacillus sp. DMB20]
MYFFYSFALLAGGLTLINFIFSYQSKHIDPHFWTTIKFQLMMIPLFLIANTSVGYGVRFGYKTTGHLSFVLIGAKCLEILISLMMGYLFFKETPSWKTWVGIGMITAGVVLVKQK